MSADLPCSSLVALPRPSLSRAPPALVEFLLGAWVLGAERTNLLSGGSNRGQHRPGLKFNFECFNFVKTL